MSNALALAAVTAVLKDLLDNALVDHSVNAAVGAPVTVTAVAPDLAADANGGAKLNLYLHRVSPNMGWRNVGLPSRSGDGTRTTNPPLALDLHYLLTAYGVEDFQAEILLGYAMQLFHERPVLTREMIRTTLAPTSPVDGSILPDAAAGLAAADLAEQVELVKLTPEEVGTEELSRLWTAFQASHRPSAAYRASVVLIEARRPARAPLPVLTIGLSDRGPTVVPGLVPPIPTITGVVPPDLKPSAYLGETVRLVGHDFAGPNRSGHVVVFEHARLDAPLEVTPSGVADAEIAVPLEIDPATDAATWPAGIYAVSVRLDEGGTERRTNVLPLALAPRIETAVASTSAATTTFTVTVTPDVLPTQRAELVVGTRTAPAAPHATATDTLTFELDDVVAGTYRLRLRVDGVESVLVDRTTTPPSFVGSQEVTV